MAEQELDPESVNRAFAAMVASYHLTSDRPDPLPASEHAAGDPGLPDLGPADLGPSDLGQGDIGPSDLGQGDVGPSELGTERAVLDHLRSAPQTPPAEPEPSTWRGSRTWSDGHPLFSGDAPAETAARYVPDPLPPLSRPGLPTLIGWVAIGFAALVVLAAGFGLVLPAWVGWLAVSGFILGSILLLTRLPRHRPPDAGDGAVL